jgi:hypothetical protein
VEQLEELQIHHLRKIGNVRARLTPTLWRINMDKKTTAFFQVFEK